MTTSFPNTASDHDDTATVPRPHGLTRLWLLLDRSASMGPTAEPMRRAVNRFLANQSDFGQKSRLSIVGFDRTGIHLLADGLDLACSTSLRRAWMEPAGTTSLHAAIDATLDLVERSDAEREARAERGEDHLVLVVTDGADNSFDAPSSTDRSRRIERLGRSGVTVVSLAATTAGRDAMVDAGVPRGNVGHYLADDAGVEAVWWWLDEATTRWRCSSRKQRRLAAATFLSEPA